MQMSRTRAPRAALRYWQVCAVGETAVLHSFRQFPRWLPSLNQQGSHEIQHSTPPHGAFSSLLRFVRP